MSKDSLLRTAKEQFKDMGVSIRGTWSDGVGEYGFSVVLASAELDATKLVVGAKKSAYRRGDDDVPVASFMAAKMVRRADDYGALLALYLDSRDEFLIYDPQAFLAYGVEPDDNSQRAKKGERWLDLPLSWGATLGDVLNGYDEPKAEPAENDDVPLFEDVLENERTGTLNDWIDG